MAKAKRIMIHCTSEPANVPRSKEYYRHLFFDIYKWSHWGYHAIVYQDGTWQRLQPLPTPVDGHVYLSNATIANGCLGANGDTIHIAYVGGIPNDGRRFADTRTPAQKKTLHDLVKIWKSIYGVTEVIGHRDWPGVKKACPCFDAKKEYSNV